ncbi:cortex morphogenetic protein CmpA [Bacillus alkalicellulosilyticus]|nr:cortex morphogenetic protein CmpA [Bacillus alkalicellulosilyticus]
MPYWLQKQLKQAYHKKDHKQVLLLNQCWFYYRRTQDPSDYKKTCEE